MSSATVRRHCDCSIASLAPFINIQTYLLTYLFTIVMLWKQWSWMMTVCVSVCRSVQSVVSVGWPASRRRVVLRSAVLLTRRLPVDWAWWNCQTGTFSRRPGRRSLRDGKTYSRRAQTSLELPVSQFISSDSTSSCCDSNRSLVLLCAICVYAHQFLHQVTMWMNHTFINCIVQDFCQSMVKEV